MKLRNCIGGNMRDRRFLSPAGRAFGPALSLALAPGLAVARGGAICAGDPVKLQ